MCLLGISPKHTFAGMYTWGTLEEMNFKKNETPYWCLRIKSEQKHYLKNNIV